MIVIVHVKELGLWPSWVETEAGTSIVRDDSVEQKACGDAFMIVIVHLKGFALWPSWVGTEAGSIADDS
jgi:uncharacterized protein YbdZ (MbtH family)